MTSPIINIIYLSTLVCLVFGEDKLFNPCNKTDVKCLGKAVADFLEKTHNGSSQYGILRTDPIEIPELKFEDSKDLGIVFDLTNAVVTGLRNTSLLDYHMDLESQKVHLTMDVKLEIQADITVHYIKPVQKSFTGTYTGLGRALVVTEYPYHPRRDDKGVLYYSVGVETTTCTPVDASVTLSPQLQQDLFNDVETKDVRESYQKRRDEDMKKAYCTLVAHVYPKIIQNLRTLANLLPVANFFKE